MSGTAELEESLLGEFFDHVLADRPAPDDLGLTLAGDDVDLDAAVAASSSQPRRLRAVSRSARRRSANASGSCLLLCCACFRRKHTKTPPPTTKKGKRLSKGKASQRGSADLRADVGGGGGGGDDDDGVDKERTITYIDTKSGKQDRRHQEQLLRARLLKSKRYAAYIKDCHAGLHARLTSVEGKKLIRKIAEDESKPVAEVVASLVKGLQEHAIRQYIKRLQTKEAAASGAPAKQEDAAAVSGSTMTAATP
jgi:hypothetical protein